MFRILKYSLDGALVGTAVLVAQNLSKNEAKQMLKTLQIKTLDAGNEALWLNREHTRLEVNQLDINRCFEYRIVDQN